MKRLSRIAGLIAVLIMTASTFAFAAGTAGGLNLVKTYPVQDATGAAIENFDVKLYFDHEMSEDILKDSNDGCFELTDENGQKYPFIVLYAPKEEGVVMVLFDQNTQEVGADGKRLAIQGDMTYTLSISGNLKDDEGNTLGEDTSVSFSTINQKRNTAVNMLLMLVMYAGIIGFSMKGMKKTAQQAAKDAKVNPYKEAKKTGKSVEEIVEKDQQRKAKEAERLAKLAEEAEDDEDDEDYLEEGHYRVKAIRTVASGGSTYITGRKAEAERKAELEARYARNKAKQGKGKKK